MTDTPATRDGLLKRRLDLVGSISAETAEALRLYQKMSGAEMEVLRLQMDITRSGPSGNLVQDLQRAEDEVAAAEAERTDCDARVAAFESEIADVDRALAALREPSGGRA